MLSISTCWNSQRHSDGAEMIAELQSFGFDAIELGHGIRVSLLPGIMKMADKVRFSSLHNFCPLPVEITHPSPDCLQFSSYNEKERERAVRQTCKTIDLAAKLGASFVVLHMGRIVMQPITSQLIRLAEEGEHLSPTYARQKVAAVLRREKEAPKVLPRVRDCLKRILDYAGEKGITLGMEGRQAYEEIPTEREAVALLAEFDHPNFGYWHDFGHIQIKHNLGFSDHAEFLAQVSPRLLGGHLHDVVWPGKDHAAPFTGGSVDYARLLPFFPPSAPLIWEMSPRRTREEIAESLDLWRSRFPR